MHSCIEAEKHEGQLWEAETDEYTIGHNDRVVDLKGYRGCFSVDNLVKVDMKDNGRKWAISLLTNVNEETMQIIKEQLKYVETQVERYCSCNKNEQCRYCNQKEQLKQIINKEELGRKEL